MTQLENQGAHTTDTAAGNFAATANAEKSTDDSGLNYVAYAAGAVDYVVFDTVGKNKTKTAASTIKGGLSQAQLQAIWTGADKCWSDVGATGKSKDDLIDPYSIYTSSAITSTWDAFLGPTDNSENYVDAQTAWPPTGVKCANGDKAIVGPSFSNYAVSHTIPQNELSAIVANKDQANAIAFISYGRYEQQKSSASFKGSAVGAPGGIAPTETTILNGTYLVPQFLYNVYSDGSNSSNIPTATPATLNFASEDGFICKPNTDAAGNPTTAALITDPNTGLTYRSEIETAITNSGFYPLDGLKTDVPFAEGTVATPASSISSFTSSTYYQYDTMPVNSNNQPLGYCLVTTSDGNTAH
jgi:hypothetical protein